MGRAWVLPIGLEKMIVEFNTRADLRFSRMNVWHLSKGSKTIRKT